MLTVYIDFKSAAAYLALKPTLRLAQRYALDVEWKPFRVVERDVPKLGKEETVGESHRRVRASSHRALNIKYAKHQNIDLVYPEPLCATDLALGSLAQMRGDPLPFIQGAFDAYWTAHRDLDDERSVQDLVNQFAADHDVDLGAARESLLQAQSEAEEIGVVGAPCYIVDGQLFVGREHLPWIEEILRNKL